MSDPALPAPRPVSLAAIIAIFIGFGLFLILVKLAYVPHPPAYIPETEVPDKLAADQQWQATPRARLAYLHELRSEHEKQLQSYGWVDRKAGVVQIPIDRAMDLVVQKYGQSKP